MKQPKNSKNFWRVFGLAAIVLTALSGAAFAALQSQPGALKGNSIQTAIASLQVSPDGNTYSTTMDGYAFGNLVPGGQPTPLNGYPVYVKNVGTTPLAVKLSVSSAISNPNNVDLSKVHIILAPTGGGTAQNMTLQELVAGNANGGVAITQAAHLLPAQVISFLVKASLDTDAVSGPGATLSNIDFNFGALAVN